MTPEEKAALEAAERKRKRDAALAQYDASTRSPRSPATPVGKAPHNYGTDVNDKPSDGGQGAGGGFQMPNLGPMPKKFVTLGGGSRSTVTESPALPAAVADAQAAAVKARQGELDQAMQRDRAARDTFSASITQRLTDAQKQMRSSDAKIAAEGRREAAAAKRVAEAKARVDDAKIDPNRFMDTMPTASKVMFAIGNAMKGFVEGFTQGRIKNDSQQIIDAAIRRDIDAQRANLKKLVGQQVFEKDRHREAMAAIDKAMDRRERTARDVMALHTNRMEIEARGAQRDVQVLGQKAQGDRDITQLRKDSTARKRTTRTASSHRSIDPEYAQKLRMKGQLAMAALKAQMSGKPQGKVNPKDKDFAKEVLEGVRNSDSIVEDMKKVGKTGAVTRHLPYFGDKAADVSARANLLAAKMIKLAQGGKADNADIERGAAAGPQLTDSHEVLNAKKQRARAAAIRMVKDRIQTAIESGDNPAPLVSVLRRLGGNAGGLSLEKQK